LISSKVQKASSSENETSDLLAGLLTVDRVLYDIPISSKKRLLEELALLLSKDSRSLDKDTVFRTLTERERLGSTGIGGGIALPHGRLNGISQCVAAAIKIREPLDFDSLDEQPVYLAIALLVPADASKQHLQVLAGLARLFSETKRRERILKAQDAKDLYEMLA